MEGQKLTLVVEPASDEILSYRLDTAAKMLSAVRRSFGGGEVAVTIPAEGNVTFQLSSPEDQNTLGPSVMDEADSDRGDVGGSERSAGVFSKLIDAGHYIERAIVGGYPVAIIDQVRQKSEWLDAIVDNLHKLGMNQPRVVDFLPATAESAVLVHQSHPRAQVFGVTPKDIDIWAENVNGLPRIGLGPSLDQLVTLEPQEVDLSIVHHVEALGLALLHTRPGGFIVANFVPGQQLGELVQKYASGDPVINSETPHIAFIRNGVSIKQTPAPPPAPEAAE